MEEKYKIFTKREVYPESLHGCPNCGECRLYYPSVKGEWGYKDTTQYECYNCGMYWDAKLIRKAQPQANA